MCLIRVAAAAMVGIALVSGCAPKEFGPAESYLAREYRVTDASVRPVDRAWYLRFDELTLSDLDDAVSSGKNGQGAEMRRLAEQVARAAGSLAVSSATGEIQRMPEAGRARLAAAVKTGSDADSLIGEYTSRNRRAVDDMLARWTTMRDEDVLGELQYLRRNVAPAPDDQGRAARQLMLFWAAIPAWMGLEKVDQSLEEKHAEPALAEEGFERAAVWHVAGEEQSDPMLRFAPTLVMEWPQERDYPEDYDRFGEVYLTGDPADIKVHVNPSRPVMYTYRSEAKIGTNRYPQLVYVWWFPERPAMNADDAAAGHLDGDTLRITLDGSGRPVVFEVVQSCGCGHLVFVSEELERRVAEQYGGILPGKKLAVERDVRGKRDLIVSGTVKITDQTVSPQVLLLAGYHEVSTLRCSDAPEPRAVESHHYRLAPYATLERLPLGDGVASMFGPDGLVHDAGRREGYLLAPTGIMSAGQPRKRGTQKIRWDEYSLEDPRLLEKTLRLPDRL